MKEQVAEVLASRIKDGDVIGIGSGSTVELTLKKIGLRIKSEGLKVSGVPTSHQAALVARDAGITVLHSVPMPRLTWGFDGADEVDPQLNMIKGNGAAMLNEKIMARSTDRLVIVVTEEKLLTKLGSRFPIPVEVIPEALLVVERELKNLGANSITLRQAQKKYGPVITEHNNVVLDCYFADVPPELEGRINNITGVVENGLFIGLASEVIVAKKDGVYSQQIKNGKFLEEKL